MESSDLAKKKCKPCEGGTRPLAGDGLKAYMLKVSGWEKVDPSSASGQSSTIVKIFIFKNYYETMAFVNSVAWISHREDHHPDMEVGYKTCKVRYTTHAIKGLSENDFICAAKVDELLK